MGRSGREGIFYDRLLSCCFFLYLRGMLCFIEKQWWHIAQKYNIKFSYNSKHLHSFFFIYSWRSDTFRIIIAPCCCRKCLFLCFPENDHQLSVLGLGHSEMSFFSFSKPLWQSSPDEKFLCWSFFFRNDFCIDFSLKSLHNYFLGIRRQIDLQAEISPLCFFPLNHGSIFLSSSEM